MAQTAQQFGQTAELWPKLLSSLPKLLTKLLSSLAQTAEQFGQTAEHLFPNKYDVFVFWVKNDVVLLCFCFMYFVMLSYLVKKKNKKQHQSQIDINTGEMKQWKFCNPIVFKKPKNYMCLFCFFGSYICLQYRVSYDIWLKNAQRDKGMKYGC